MAKKNSLPSAFYFVYILKCADNTLYIGSTNDLEKRLLAHNTAKTGAKYTKARRPVTLVYLEKITSTNVKGIKGVKGTKNARSARGAALKREWELKKLTRFEKLMLIGN